MPPTEQGAVFMGFGPKHGTKSLVKPRQSCDLSPSKTPHCFAAEPEPLTLTRAGAGAEAAAFTPPPPAALRSASFFFFAFMRSCNKR